MPDFPPAGSAPRKTSLNFNVTFLAAGGDDASVQLTDLETTVTGIELAGARAAAGSLSNAVVVRTTQSEVVEISPTRANPFDEAYASASTKLILTFQNDELEIKSLAIPAPDEQFFGGDGVTMITPDAAAAVGTPAKVLADAIRDIRAVINGGLAGSGTYQLLTGYRSERTRKLQKPKTVRPSIEPTGQEPGGEPGV